MKNRGISNVFYGTMCFVLISAILVTAGIFASKIISASSVTASVTAGYTVIIDAGHGGPDGGASADDGTLEKDLNLSVAKKLKELFSSAGINVIMTREEDVSLGADAVSHKKAADLAARVNIAKNTPGAIFVSVHMNKFPVEKYSGLQVYFSKNDPSSAALAENIQTAAREYLQPENNRETKSADDSIYVLDNAPCPAVLVECGFLSNLRELERLKNDDYQKSLAVCIFSAVVDFLGETNTNV